MVGQHRQVRGEEIVDLGCDGGGTCATEAAAVAWINTSVSAWWVNGPGMSDEAYAKVPRHVPDGYRFELSTRPLTYA